MLGSLTSAPPSRAHGSGRGILMSRPSLCCSPSGHRSTQVYARGEQVLGSQVWLSRESYQVNAALSLNTLQDEEIKLREPIPVRLRWDSTARAYVAYEEALGLWYGIGLTPADALADLAEVMCELYRELEENKETLAPPLQHDFSQMQRVIVNAGSNP